MFAGLVVLIADWRRRRDSWAKRRRSRYYPSCRISSLPPHHHLWSAALAVHQPPQLSPTSPKSHPWLVRRRGAKREIVFHCQSWQPGHTGTIMSQASDVRPAAPLPPPPFVRVSCVCSTCWSSDHRDGLSILLILQRCLLGDLRHECGGSCVQWLLGNMRQQAVNITQLVLAGQPQGWAAELPSSGQMRDFQWPKYTPISPRIRQPGLWVFLGQIEVLISSLFWE